MNLQLNWLLASAGRARARARLPIDLHDIITYRFPSSLVFEIIHH